MRSHLFDLAKLQTFIENGKLIKNTINFEIHIFKFKVLVGVGACCGLCVAPPTLWSPLPVYSVPRSTMLTLHELSVSTFQKVRKYQHGNNRVGSRSSTETTQRFLGQAETRVLCISESGRRLPKPSFILRPVLPWKQFVRFHGSLFLISMADGLEKVRAAERSHLGG